MIKNQKGFQGYANWYKGNLHSHTTNSDGKLSPSEAAALYRHKGYHFLCFSEHDLYTDYTKEFNEPDFMILPGMESSAVLWDVGGGRPLATHHMHGIKGSKKAQQEAKKTPLKHMERWERKESVGIWNEYEEAQKLNDALRERGLLTTYNHPIWSKVSEEAVCYIENLWAVEIYNYNTVNESGTGYNTTFWDRMLRTGKRVHGFASDDNHNEGFFPDSGGGFVVVNAEELTHEAIVRNLQSGNFYSSSGPKIMDWGVRDGNVYVECSPVNRVNFICGNRVNYGGTVMGREREDEVTVAEYELQGDETYVRIECVDKYGYTAWSNALFMG